MRPGPAGLMAVIPQQQVHQSQSQAQGQPQPQQPSSHGRPNSLPPTPITLGHKRLSDEDVEQNGTDAKR